MSSKTKTAEQEFREAFERLKTNKPERLEKGSQVTQNNVAREAGRDPSSLRKGRYPTLIYEIQAYTTVIRESATKKKQRSDNRTRSSRNQLKSYKRQRDELVSIIEAQRDHIDRLTEELEQLKEGKITTVR